MKVTKTSVASAIAMVCVIALTIMANTKRGKEEIASYDKDFKVSSKESAKIVSRFLSQKDPRPKSQCNKDDNVCQREGSLGSTCCNNKCIDVVTDDKNCGACMYKCKYTQKCCNGKCVDLNIDKSHCGSCGNNCMTGGYCAYGMCDYA